MELTERLYRRLLSALPPDGSDAGPTFSIGDLYQRLIPYRAVRGEVGVLELAEYEHALLRLLSGEGGRLQVEDEEARMEMQRELASVNPILGIYRDYDFATFRILPGARADADPDDPETTGSEASVQPEIEAVRRVSVDPEPDAPSTVPDAPAAPEAERPSTRLPAPSGESTELLPSTPAQCVGCDRTLPDVPDVRFCPYCGRSQALRECAACGTPLEGGWSFCISCGAGRAT